MPPMKLVAAVTAHDEIRCRLRLCDEKLQDGKGSLVGPVKVLNYENCGRDAGILANRSQERAGQAITVRRRLR